MEYVKINSLWKREGWYAQNHEKKNKQAFIVGDYAHPAFGNVKTWRVSEKIDGTNIRIVVRDGIILFQGRTQAATIQPNLFEYLRETFTGEKILDVLRIDPNAFPAITLFGEGYGPKIQAVGANYRDSAGFILFDVVRHDRNWLDRVSVVEIGAKLGVPVVPDLGVMTEDQIVEFVKSRPMSLCSLKHQIMEGVVCRAEPEVYFKHGAPVMFKLKCRDFEQ